MQILAEELESYLSETFGLPVRVKPDLKTAEKLPIFFGALYSTWETTIVGHPVILLFQRKREAVSPAQVAKHVVVARTALGRDVAFVFPTLQSFERKRLVHYHVPFIVPERQTYLPDLLIDLRDLVRGQRVGMPDDGRVKHLSTPAQVLLLHGLQHRLGEGDRSLKNWAILLEYSGMTASRICDELVGLELCESEQNGKRVLLHLGADRLALWNKALPFLRSPKLRIAHVQVARPDTVLWYNAGISALSRYTMLAEGRNAVYAMSAAEYRRAKEDQRLVAQASADDSSIVVEQWRYRPAKLSEDNRTVDRLSLYLTLKDDRDERVEAALVELLEGVKW